MVSDRISRPHARQTLGGLMGGIAATAIGFGLARAYLDDADAVFRPRPPGIQLLALVPCLAAWSSALLLAPVRRPRLRRVALRPGHAACLAAAVGVLAGLGEALARLGAAPPWKSWSMPTDRLLLLAVLAAPLPAGAAVAAAWASLLLAGRWRCGRGLREIAGIAIGVAWIAMTIAVLLMRMGDL